MMPQCDGGLDQCPNTATFLGPREQPALCPLHFEELLGRVREYQRRPHQSAMTYDTLSEHAMELLAEAGQLTMIEQAQHGMKHLAVSANECLGMATRVIAEQAKNIQVLADGPRPA